LPRGLSTGGESLWCGRTCEKAELSVSNCGIARQAYNFQTYLQHKPVRDSSDKNKHLFKEVELRIIKQAAIALHDFEAIEHHFDMFSQLSARITFPQDGTTSIELEFPVKHINLQRTQRFFQVETGPVLFPTKISSAADVNQSMPEFNPAFIHFNRLDEIEITLKVPTRAGLQSTLFYSETKKLCAQVILMVNYQNLEKETL